MRPQRYVQSVKYVEFSGRTPLSARAVYSCLLLVPFLSHKSFFLPPDRPGRKLWAFLFGVGAWVCLLGVAPSATAQRILLDSARDPSLTLDDEVNDILRVKIGFEVALIRPEWLTPKGKKVKYGFDKWYVHVVRTRSAYLQGAPTNTRDYKLLLAIATREKRAPDPDTIPDTLRSRALFIKGIIDRTDSLKHYRRLTDSLIQRADSLDSWVTDPEDANDPTNQLLQQTLSQLRPLQDKLNVYGALERFLGRPRRLIKLFFGPVFHNNLKYSIQAKPYGLPKLVYEEPEKVVEPKELPRKKKKKPYNPGKYRQRKLDKKKTNWGRKRFRFKSKSKSDALKNRRKPLDLKDLGLF